LTSQRIQFVPQTSLRQAQLSVARISSPSN
jgi:hypothetical protein